MITQTFLIYTQSNIINTKKNEFHNKATRTRDNAMLLFLRRPEKNAVAFCAFENIRELLTAENKSREQRSGCIQYLRHSVFTSTSTVLYLREQL